MSGTTPPPPGKSPPKGAPKVPGTSGLGLPGAKTPGIRPRSAAVKLPGVGGAVAAARTLTDPATSVTDKAAAGAAAAIGAAASPLAGKVAGTVLKSKSGRKLLAVAAALVALLLVGAVVAVGSVVQAASMLLASGGSGSAASTCGGAPAAGTDATLTADQQANATAIINAVTARALGAEDATIAIMTALTESGLTNVANGDLAGPDSRGLFQQRDSWGPLTVRMDPTGTTGLFLDRLTAPALKLYRTQTPVNDTPTSRPAQPPWMVAQSVQISAFADGANYRSKYARAVEIVTSLAGSAPANAQTWVSQSGSTLPASGVAPLPGATPLLAPTPPTASECSGSASGVGPAAWGGWPNGAIPLTAMCPVPWQPTQYQRCDAIAALVAMNVPFKAAFGADLAITDGYRDYATQVALKAQKGIFAATPGTSNHGWGLALDLGSSIDSWVSPQRQWMVANAPGFGWVSPPWAQADKKPEPWHWDFNGTTTAPPGPGTGTP